MELNLIPLLPELFLAIIGMGLLLVGATRGNEATSVISGAAIIGLAIASVILGRWSWNDDIILGGMFKFDDFAGVMQMMIIAGLAASLLLSIRYLPREDINRFEYPILIIFAGIGMMLMVSAYNLLALYMAMELQSLSLYVLAAFRRNSTRSAEAGVKYFALGAISSGMLLFGISLIYGFTGSLDYGVLEASLSSLSSIPMGVTFGLVLMLAGIAFKISAVPFHMWTPDVYQGAPTSVTALFAMVPKIAAIGLMARLLFEPFAFAHEQWIQIIWFLAAASMIASAFAAIAQGSIKRLMAYSSIGNMGYALMGIAAGTMEGVASVVIYMMIYMAMTAGTFAVIMSMRRHGIKTENINDLAGLSRTSPILAYSLAILMFSMSGIPPMAGFFSKLLVFQAAVDGGLYVLATIGVLSSVVAAFYYLKIVKVMFFDAQAETFDGPMPLAWKCVLGLSIAFTMGFIFMPSFFIDQARLAASALIPG